MEDDFGMTRTMIDRLFRGFTLLLLATLITMSSAQRANAQGFISPLIGYNFGGDAGCPEITNCEDKHVNWGVAFGALGPIVGFEAEIAKTNDFFGKTANQSTSVVTFMGNFMIAPKIGPVQPYGLIGAGLMRTSVESVASDESDNDFSWDIGGGLIIFFSKHIGIRGDIRYFHSFQITSVFGAGPGGLFPNLGEEKLNFGRVAGAMMFKF